MSGPARLPTTASADPADTFLFVPGNRPERFAKARASGAGAVILDLEDSVPAADRAAARRAVADALAAAAATPQAPGAVPLWVRVHALGHPDHADDVEVLRRGGAAGVVLPKCEGRDDVLALGDALQDRERRWGLPAGGFAVVAIVTETARAVQRLHTLDGPLPRLQGLLWGAEDLAAQLGLRSLRDRDGRYLSPALHARDATLLAARACGAAAIDAAFTALDDAPGLHAETAAHARLGFTAKAAIHPGQIDVIRRARRPDEDDLAWAREVIAELQDGARAAGRVRGAMVDEPHLAAARRLLSAVRS